MSHVTPSQVAREVSATSPIVSAASTTPAVGGVGSLTHIQVGRPRTPARSGPGSGTMPRSMPVNSIDATSLSIQVRPAGPPVNQATSLHQTSSDSRAPARASASVKQP